MKRYVVTADFYMYADNDDQAKEQAQNWSREFDIKNDNQAKVKTIHEAPFASMKPRLIEN